MRNLVQLDGPHGRSYDQRAIRPMVNSAEPVQIQGIRMWHLRDLLDGHIAQAVFAYTSFGKNDLGTEGAFSERATVG